MSRANAWVGAQGIVGVAGEVVLQSVEQADKAVGLGVTGIVGRRGANRSHR